MARISYLSKYRDAAILDRVKLARFYRQAGLREKSSGTEYHEGLLAAMMRKHSKWLDAHRRYR